MRPKISILICAHNEEKYISTAIESVIIEKDLDLEVVVVDDRSTDGTSNIINNMASNDARIKVITRVDDANEEDVENGFYYMVDHGYGGQTDALNLGLKHCSGDYIARLDADDVNYPERLVRQLEFMENNPDVSFVASSATRIDSEGQEFGQYHSKPMTHEKILENIETFKAFAPHSSWFVRASVYHELDGYHSEGFRAEDYDFMLRASELKSFKFAFIEQPLIYLRMQDGRLSTRLSTVPVEHAVEALVRHMLRLDNVLVTKKIQSRIRKKVSDSINSKNIASVFIAYRSLVNGFIAIKRKNLLDLIYCLYLIIKNRPMILYNRNLLSDKKLKIALQVFQSIRQEDVLNNES